MGYSALSPRALGTRPRALWVYCHKSLQPWYNYYIIPRGALILVGDDLAIAMVIWLHLFNFMLHADIRVTCHWGFAH